MQCPYEHALYMKVRKDDILFVALYVDDLIFSENNLDMIEKFNVEMTKEFEMTDLDIKCHIFSG